MDNYLQKKLNEAVQIERLIDPAVKLIGIPSPTLSTKSVADKLAEILDLDSPEEIYYNLVSHWKNPNEVVLGASEPTTLVNDLRTAATTSGGVRFGIAKILLAEEISNRAAIALT